LTSKLTIVRFIAHVVNPLPPPLMTMLKRMMKEAMKEKIINMNFFYSK